VPGFQWISRELYPRECGPHRSHKIVNKRFARRLWIISQSAQAEARSKMVQKGLAFQRERSGTVTVPGAISGSGSRPAGCLAVAGPRW
jgi:hypothetical protein